MRPVLSWFARLLSAVVIIPALLVLAVWAGANTRFGRDLIVELVPRLTGRTVSIESISGQFPQAVRVRRIELRDDHGVWLTIDDAALHWSPSRLFSKRVDIDHLTAAHVAVLRAPISNSSSTGSGFALPLPVIVKDFKVDRLDVSAELAGTPVALEIQGSGRARSLEDVDVVLTAHPLGPDGFYSVTTSLSTDRVRLEAVVREPPHGLVSAASGLPDLGPIVVSAKVDGPRDAVAVSLQAAAGELQADVSGTVDLVAESGDLRVSARAPAMRPRADIGWRAIALDGSVSGSLVAPKAAGSLRIESLEAAGAAVRTIEAKLDGDPGHVHLNGSVDGVRVPGPRPELLAAAPIEIEADVRLDAAGRPINFSIHHPLLTAEGKGGLTGTPVVDTKLTLADLSPLAEAAGVDLRGRADLTVGASRDDQTTSLTARGTVSVTGGTAPLPALIGPDATVDIAASLNGNDLSLSPFRLEGKTLALTAQGGVIAHVADFDWTLALSDLAVIAPTLAGSVSGQGHVSGPLDDFAVTALLDGDVAVKGLRRGPIRARLDAKGLPNALSGTLTADGELAQAPLSLAADIARGGDGTARATVTHLDWKSLHAAGALTLPQGGTLPLGKIDLRMIRLDDLRPLIGQPLSGGLTGTLETSAQKARLTVDARGVAIPGTGAVDKALLEVTVTDPLTRPVVDARLSVDGGAAGGPGGSVKIEARGPKEAVAVNISADLRQPGAGPVRLNAKSVVNATTQYANVSSLQAEWRGQTAHLIAPVRVAFADGVILDRLTLGVGQAVLDISGRVSPTLDATISARNVTPDLAKSFLPGLDVDGRLSAEAKLTGTPAQPFGTVRLDAQGLRSRTGPSRALPPANLTATAQLRGSSASVDAHLAAGKLTSMTVTGQVPLMPMTGPLNLRATGGVDLALLDPLISADGRRVRGQIALDAGVAGTLAAPRLSGTARLTDGRVRDVTSGLRITEITSFLELNGTTIRVAQFEGRAGTGTISIAGTVGIGARGIPVDLSLTARNATPLASDELTVSLDADATLTGHAIGGLQAGGNVRLNRVDVVIPERLPPKVAVLNVVRPGAVLAPPSRSSTAIALDLTIDAPGQILVHGRGLDAELGGRVHLRGTAANPIPDGSFTLKRGDFSLVGNTLKFTNGRIGFDNGSIADPAIDFVATRQTNSGTASLEISGTAANPKFEVSSSPRLPKDEALALLLFGRSASALGPVELAQLATALATLSGATSGIGDPVADIRKALGLDRLSVGGSSLQIGRNIAPGVYIGARQSLTGTGTQATIEFEVLPGLTVEGALGTSSATAQGTQTIGSGVDPGGSGVTVRYKLEY